MNEELDSNIENLSEEEIVFEQVLRPKQFDDFFGQEQIVENLKIFSINLASESLILVIYLGRKKCFPECYKLFLPRKIT